MLNIDPASQGTTFAAPVSPRFRIVPNGFAAPDPTTGTVTLKATLLVTPVPDPMGRFDLTTWPVSAVALIAGSGSAATGLQARMLLTPRSGTPTEIAASLVSLGAAGWRKALTDNAARLSDAWEDSLVPSGRDGGHWSQAWTHLMERLTAIQTGKRAQAGAIDSGTAERDPQFGDQGQFKAGSVNNDRKCDAIMSTGYTDAALALDLQRGREVIVDLEKAGELDRDLPDTDPPVKVERKVVPLSDEAIKTLAASAEPEREIEVMLTLIAKGTPFRIPPGSDNAAVAEATLAFEEVLLARLHALGKASDIATVAALRLTHGAPLKAAYEARFQDAQADQRKARWMALSSEMQTARNNAREAFATARKALEDNTLQRVCRFESVNPEQAAGARSAALRSVRIASEYGRWPQHEDADDAARKAMGEFARAKADQTARRQQALAHIGNAFFGIDGNPGLSRVFGLAFDLSIAFDAAALAAEPYGLLSIAHPDVPEGAPGSGRETIWTRLKLRRPERCAPDHGWPVTTAEVLAWQAAETADVHLPAHCIGQFEGVMSMAGVPEAPKTGRALPRFDITNLDVGAAMEAERSWLQAIETLNDGRTPTIAERQAMAIGPDYQSNGLTLLCRSAVDDAVRKLAAISVKICGDGKDDSPGDCMPPARKVHDAEDLTNGYRLVVGVPVEAKPDEPWLTDWRPLMGRTYAYGHSGRHGDLVERMLAVAVGPAGSQARVLLESAMQAIPSRDVAMGGNAVETIVDETYGLWDGTPAGVACGEVPGTVEKMPDANAFGRRVDIPSGATIDKPVFLRNGRPYRFALEVVYAGGRSVSERPREWNGAAEDGLPACDAIAPPRHDDVRARLYYPSWGQIAASGAQGRAMPFVRCLRHARVGAPTVLLPRGHALRDNGAMGYDSVGKMIVRSIRPAGGPDGTATGPDDRDRKRATPTVAQRLVLVPPVPQATAARHHAGADRQAGVFDRLESKGAPPGALSKVKYGRQGAKGFPVARTTTKPGFDGVRHEVSRRLETDTDPGRIAPDDELANPVFAPEYGQRTPTTYYPDPAADTLVIRLRRGGGEAAARAILPESPLQVPVAASRYPDGLPVLLSLRQSRRRDRMAEPSHATVLTPPREVFFDALAEKDIVRLANGGYRATEVELLLQPGDHFEVEMWLVPSAWRLAHDFAAVQSMAQYLCKRGGATVDCNVETLLNGIAKEGSATMEGLEGTAGGVRYVGPGGDILPPTRMLLTLAERLYAHMLRHPVHEIAGVRRIEAIHAVNVHDERPRAHALPPGIDPFPGRDPEPLPQTAIRAIRPARLGDAVAGFSDDTAIAAGSKHLALTGTVKIDREFVDTLEIVARTVSPQSAVFDDPDRRRSLAHRLAGTWPASLDQPGTPRQARHVFGFRVAADGRVRLPEGEVTLLRIDNLPLPRPEDGPGRRSIDLAPYFLQLGEQATATSRRHVFPDGKARRLDIRINALARTAEMMATAARQIGSADPWLATSGVVVEKGDLVGSEPVSRQLLANFSDRVEVIMPATVRPAAVRAKAPVPVFETTVETFVGDGGRPGIRVLRRAKTRIPLGRGWFDSGVDERLGLVIWPPGQELQDHPDLAANYVRLRDGIADSPRTPLLPGGICPGGELGEPPQQTAPGRRVKLPDFEDDDLGPGGRFVTRRGMDPIRIGDGLAADPSETQVFLSKEAFPDLWRDPADPALAEYVPHTLMPLADAGEAAAAKDGTRTEDQVPPMAVGLVVYAPRFDPELEEWYADVHLRPGVRADSFVRFGLVRYQPHTRPNLRCSRPVVQWAQPLPDRTVTVETTGMHGHEVLTVTMSGPVSIGRARQATSGDTALKVQEDARDAPVMRVSLFEERRTAAGGLGRITLELPPRAAAATGSVLATTGGDTKVRHEVRPSTVDKGQATWTWTLPLVSLPGANFGRLKLAVDEIEYFLPASLGTGREPLAADALATFDSALWREAGPRFSTVVNLADLVPIAKTPSD